ncbi:hypothetical protein [Hafnia alvei]|uniref:Uncharacterized protein n=1 Tax=Hafnia alvei ATCC 51873 TaxID=1002364 RepID=G9YAX0_HAFAL|nr:hypothetical protein [Hafnia alvei]EHM39699.1 hypothetical protein HMPREF0454_03747 [Hafnia alvei ATCC 51873]QQE46127.1 hypothetical protein I6H95_22910 [Hafnia alvei]
MPKLTTERLEKLQDNLLQFQDAYSDPADKENYEIFVDALHVIDEFKAAKEKLLAYEQAAKNPVAWNHTKLSEGCGMTTPLYAAPVLPKQPELIGMKVSIDTGSDNIGHRLFGEIVGTSDSNGVPVLCIEVAENNGDMAAPAQPVIPEQQTVQLDPHVYRELVNELRDVALEYHSAQQLRERISRALSKAATAAHPHLEQPVSEPCKLCWSCGNSFTYTQRLECDGYCPHCDSPIDLDEDEDEEALKADS